MDISVEEARDLTDRIRMSLALRQLQPRREERPTAPVEDRRSVYFIRATNGLVKIGVAHDPKERLRTIQGMSPLRLELVGVLPGLGARGEAALHERFSYCRSHGEWFYESPGLTELIEGAA